MSVGSWKRRDDALDRFAFVTAYDTPTEWARRRCEAGQKVRALPAALPGQTIRLFVLAVTLSLANFTVASAQTSTPDSENGRYNFSPVADGVLRLDTRTGQISQCSRSDVGWACKVVPDERTALETEIARLQGENATLKKELLARGLPVPGVWSPSGAKPGEPELKLPSDAEVDKVISFLERVWRRLIEMGRDVQKDIEKKN